MANIGKSKKVNGKKVKNLFEEGDAPIRGGRIAHGKTKTLTKTKWERQKFKTGVREGRDGGFIKQDKIFEDEGGAKWKRRTIKTAPDAVGGTKDLATANNRERGYYSAAGKGDAPRNVGPKFHENFKKIKGMVKREDGVVRGGKWKKVYK